MKRKFLFRILTLFLLTIFSAQAQVFAAGIVLRIPFDGLTAYDGSAIDPDYTGPGSVDSANVEFFRNSVPDDATSPSNRIDNFDHNTLAAAHQYENMGINGNNVYIRSWAGSPRTLGSHYGISTHYTAASGGAPAEQYPVADFRTDYLANIPTNAPRITSVTEANKRVGETQDVVLDLSVEWTYDRGAAPNIIVATGYDLKYWIGDPGAPPGDADPNRVVSVGGGSWNLPDNDPVTGAPFGAGTYNFQVRAKNVFGAGPWSDILTWTTLSGGPGGPETVTYNFRRPGGEIGLNPISFPFASVTDVTNLRQLITAINTQAGANVVTAAGWWDVANQRPTGYIITYSSDTVNDINDFITAGGAADDPASVTLVKDQTYQISVLADATASLTGTR